MRLDFLSRFKSSQTFTVLCLICLGAFKFLLKIPNLRFQRFSSSVNSAGHTKNKLSKKGALADSSTSLSSVGTVSGDKVSLVLFFFFF